MPTTTSTSGPADWMQPYYQQYLQGAFQTANKPYQQYQGNRVAGMSSIQQGALGGINQGMYGTPQTQQAGGLLSNVMAGDNPYVNQIAQQVADQSRQQYEQNTAAVNSRFKNPNSFGNSRHAMMQDSANEAYARGLSGSLANLRYGAFDTNAQRQLQAAGMADQQANSNMQRLGTGLTAGNIPRQIQQQQYDTGYQDWQNWNNYPTQQTDNLGRWLGMGGNSTQTTQQTPNPSQGSQIAGGLLAALPAMAGIFGWGQ